MTAISNVHRLPNRDAALKALYTDIAAKNMFPFWATSADVANDEIKQLMATPRAVPFLWRCKEDIEPILNQAVELITMDDSERRSLVLVNPGLAPKRATVSTMYTAYRLNDANEIMPPHKHSPSAIRFGLKGTGNFTGVDGENIIFGPGDMVLTPNDTWHNHGNRRRRAGDQSFGARSAPWSRRSTPSISTTTTPRKKTASRAQEAADGALCRPTIRSASTAMAD